MSTDKQPLGLTDAMKRFDMVEWDRWAGSRDNYSAFGWIKRSDGQRDFLALDIVDGEIVDFVTSSAKYSKKFCEIMGWEHSDCVKIDAPQG